MLLVDLEQGRLIPDEELKATLAKSHPYKQWLEKTQIVLEDMPIAVAAAPISNLPLLDRQQTFGYTQEDLKLLMTPMAAQGEEAVGSMGTDTPISALSDKSKLLFTYFKQNFAQVTNPPIDPIREEIVMSLVSIIGPRPNLFDLEGSSRTKRLEVRQPILTNEDLEKIRAITEVADNHFKSITLDMTWPAVDGAAGMEKAIDALSAQAEQAVRDGINIIILSDRKAGTDRVPMPSLLGCAAVHHHLIRQGLRTSVGLVVESAEPREVHHFGCLAGYGAEAINPYLAFETLIAMHAELPGKLDKKEIVKRYIKAIDKGLLKVMSKMGISTYQSYCGAQIFDAVGLKAEFVNKYFTGTATRIEGVGPERDRRGGGAAATATRSATRRCSAACSTSAANTPCACAARTTSGTPPRSRPCSTRCAATPRTSTARSRRSSTSRTRWSPSAACSASRPRRRTSASPCRSRRSSRPRTSSSASPPARCRSARSRARRTPRSPSP